MAEQELKIVLTAKDDASSKIKSIASGIESGLQKVGIAAAAVGVGMVAFGKSSIDAFAEAERSQRQLEHAIIDVSHGSSEQVAAINAVSSALQAKVGVDADAINMGAAQLATFGLQSESVVNLTKSMADYAVNQAGVNAGSQDYIMSANTIAKALNGQFGALEKTGVRFTAHQQELIMTGTEAQKVATIQEGLAQNLRETTDTLNGADVAQARLAASMGEIKESVGAALLPALDSLAQKLVPIIDSISKWIADNPELTMKIVEWTAAILGILIVLPLLITAIKAVGTAIMFVAANPIVLIIAAIAALVAAVVLMIQNWDAVKAKAEEIWNGIKETIEAALNKVKEVINSIITAITDVWNSFVEGIKNTWQAGWDAMSGAVAAVAGTIMGIINGIIDTISKAVGKIKELAAAAGAAAKEYGQGVADRFNGGHLSPSSSGGWKKTNATGGNVFAGQTSLVGEKGPEMVTFGRSGTVTPNNRLGGGTTVVVNVSGNNVLGGNIRQFSEMIGDEIINTLRINRRLA